MKKRVLLGMSGGVDSSVAAVLLKEQGYEVIGITMKLIDDEEEGTCCNLSSTCDAKRVCDFLEIPHYTINFKKEFKKYVIDDFINCYKNCITPNPCIECNKYLKFGAMYQKAQELNCDYIATGHYAKIEYDEKYGHNVLKRSNASGKDQSYVLYNLPRELVDKVLFPLGNFENKDQIRKIAREYNLPVANKPDSEDICFIPDGNYKKFLEEKGNLIAKTGNIVDTSGKILGKHKGLFKYTVGQRRGLGIANDYPLFVLKLDKEKNRLIVGSEKEQYVREFFVKDVNFITIDKANIPMEVYVKTRYSALPHKAQIIPYGENLRVIFEEKQKYVTPGQAAVFYVDDVVIGGGKIYQEDLAIGKFAKTK